MGKTFTKGLFIAFIGLFVMAGAIAQTITVGAIDPGPYGRGSTISVPIQIDNTNGCIAINNIYTLFLSDASGSFAAETQIGTMSGFYATFVNGVIPAGISGGTGYRLRVKSSSPAVISNQSGTFTINTVTGVVAGLTSQLLNNNNPEVFGVCIANADNPPPPYDFEDNSTAGATVTADFFNELSQTLEAGNKPIPASFNAGLANYTITVKAKKDGLVGTKSFILINNVVNNSFSASGSTTVCLNGASQLTYNVIITGTQGIERNYPGLSYNVNWGDGVIVNYTLCDILKAGGKVVHNYSISSCGRSANGQNNVFKVDLQPVSPYCSNIVPPLTSYAKVLSSPKNDFNLPANACTGSAVTFINASDPGMDPNSTGSDCRNLSVRYLWYVNDVLKSQPLRFDQSFVYTFPTHGNYKVTLRLQNNNGLCNAEDKSHDICVQDAPNPDFTIPAVYCLSAGPLSPVNNSLVDEFCNNNATYNWVLVNGPAGGVSFNAAAKIPAFNFNRTGVYKFRLDITTLNCGLKSSVEKEIVVNTVPTATLAPDVTQCGTGVPISFDPTAIFTKTVLTGTAQATPTTYVWAISSPNGGTFSYAPGSTANSQYPRIIFNDYATYKITITHSNNCGTATATQQLKFVQAPTVFAGPPQSNICEGAPVILAASPGTGGLVSTVRWTSPTAGQAAFSPANTPNTTYTPTATDIANGQVLLTYTATTSLDAPCNEIASTVLITFVKKATVTSTDTKTVCSGSPLNYTITSANPATVFNYTAALSSGTATGFSATGSGSTINDVIINNNITDAIVTYTITPVLNGCTGTPFTLTVTINAQTIGGTVDGTTTVCPGNNNGVVTLTGNLGNILRWESSVNSGATWLPVTNTGNTLTYLNATQTIQYRAVVQNGSCSIAFSSAATLNVTQPVTTANAGADPPPLCNQTTITLEGNNPQPFNGIWTLETGPAAGVVITDPTNPKSTVTGLTGGNTYIFRWTINAPPCESSYDEVVITNLPDVTTGFTLNNIEGCGPVDVQFTNTSSHINGVNFIWDFGDGTPTSNEINPQHIFQPKAGGVDFEYTVSLTIADNCTNRPAFIKTVKVHPVAPAPRAFPDLVSGCGDFPIVVENKSFATYKLYTYILFDENGTIETKTNTTGASETFNLLAKKNPKIYKVKLVVVDFCNQTGESQPQSIVVSPYDIRPGLQVENDVTKGCYPLTVKLINASTGGDNFKFHITSTDGTVIPLIPVVLDGSLNYTFPNPGIYYVSVIALSSCGSQESDPILHRIEIYEKPRPDFKADKVIGKCDDVEFTFTNTTIPDPSSQASELTYDWDFGDGTPHSNNYNNVKHKYAPGTTPYTVTLTVTNPNTGCSDIKIYKDLITVYAKPLADFDAKPGFETAIPNYHFEFADKTVGTPVKWTWTFGDGQSAMTRYPTHTYGDVGEFDVTLTVEDSRGCIDVISKKVKITGVPGFLYLPNAFQPQGSAVMLQKFTAKGSGIAKWQLQIFNNWGQLLWQTNALGSNGEPVEGWDGTFKGVMVQQGTYIWQASATFINGTEWKGMSYNGSLPKRSGYISLLK
ncbi:PKD domain-containing protein [Mucilaginibacter phyllosphaerae]|uniref:PKD domain-containing protein n=1 Tax=Mucilaginibacter phyllosphaerae TaxID=1812349 RepID=A0A4Y8AC59_9SPHI|nr:PKD domain-containing protein [Mucilaginibacter phyllosphaerae]MBB3969079.1 PKD repeat protein [Mucilaginibacter phyllosphaerae]TEW66103.1 PKD domain-containing protein [Mucilaginibacter phyllosphaerae]GGH06103.1 hypothetical protein GCM10007352_10240 [Mucilaginibacter phyllosphaerae]